MSNYSKQFLVRFHKITVVDLQIIVVASAICMMMNFGFSSRCNLLSFLA